MAEKKEIKKENKEKSDNKPITSGRFRIVDTSRYTAGRAEKRSNSSSRNDKGSRLGYF